ncbi:MAG: glycine--tRNA ligase [Chloroflexi bacterium]|nr:glycine--tRNA ligase [Chloroflexota bacterium]
MDKIVSLCKRRGFIFQSSEIYGGLASTYDYGPLGIELKRNIRDAWWRTFIQDRDDMVGIETAILMHPQVWVASGHAGTFTDPLVECKACHHRFRADHIDSKACPDCGGALTPPRNFNLMLKTFLGPVEDTASQAYLRPETAQGIFVNFQNVLTATRKRLPFGIGQIGKSFRNEITTGNFTFRTREFEQMEIEFFVKPGTDEEWHQHWTDLFMQWFLDLGVRPDRLRLRPHASEELSHYSKATSDIEYSFAWGWGELMGIANRTDFDLKAHTEHSGVRLDYFDDDIEDPAQKHYVPYVVEPALGVDRALLVFLFDAYDEEALESGDTRVVLHFHPSIAPIKVAVLPLSRNERLVPKAREVYDLVRSRFVTQYDDAQSIGRRYRRQDEIGTPLAVTVDFQTLDEDNAVTIRDRDTMQQVRVPISELLDTLAEWLNPRSS